ncbi:hypothetical protein AB1Y20_003342 [Prymnesium parvum]|uniref:Fimbrin n=1 Tax=Prymnesium parvum TaxID=97485 RepID=A0AB34JAL3_PRYPA|eukprot:CAMPEP_0195576604 /NCGR_PEP_ID=MMETSP0814-20130614/9132_1 /TAXON_ID=97485 /ORGANISM="Prymnesium parvum, Strain Texoma1" /LENGTH=1085 /DNA_ID=CAMNT_0040712895 /DNA_START=33 /DNA_END=3290 /DNA_ORIENTATION=-
MATLQTLSTNDQFELPDEALETESRFRSLSTEISTAAPPLKHVETVDKSAPVIEGGVKIKENPFKSVLAEIGEPTTPARLKHVDEAKDASAPLIDPSVVIKPSPFKSLNAEIAEFAAATEAAGGDKRFSLSNMRSSMTKLVRRSSSRRGSAPVLGGGAAALAFAEGDAVAFLHPKLGTYVDGTLLKSAAGKHRVEDKDGVIYWVDTKDLTACGEKHGEMSMASRTQSDLKSGLKRSSLANEVKRFENIYTEAELEEHFAMFKEYDLDDSGFLSATNLLAILEAMGIEATRQQVNNMIEEVAIFSGHENDGHLSFRDYIMCLEYEKKAGEGLDQIAEEEETEVPSRRYSQAENMSSVFSKVDRMAKDRIKMFQASVEEAAKANKQSPAAVMKQNKFAARLAKFQQPDPSPTSRQAEKFVKSSIKAHMSAFETASKEVPSKKAFRQAWKSAAEKKPPGSVFGRTAVMDDETAQQMRELFNSFDTDKSGKIDLNELEQAMSRLGIDTTKEKLAAMMDEADEDKNHTISFDEFVKVVERSKTTGAGSMFSTVVTQQAAQLLQQKKDNVVHSFAMDECLAFVNHINRKLGNDPQLKYLLPISTKDVSALFPAVSDGVLLCKLINEAVPETIDERVLNLSPTNKFHITENQNSAINGAKSIGIKVVNIGAGDLIDATPHLILGLIWQLVKLQLVSNINLKSHPFLVRLLQEGETLEAFMKLSPEKILMRWFNYHLAQAGCSRRVNNWGSDLQDSELYAHLLQQIDPEKLASTRMLKTSNLHERAKYIATNGARMGAEFTIQPEDIVGGNEKLNFGFTAALFNACPGLEDEEVDPSLLADMPDEDEDDSREERAFRMWINSLGLDAYVVNLFDDLRDGLVILQTMDHVKPGVVAWSKVNKACRTVFQKTENQNYAVSLAKDPFSFSLVGVQGKDLVDGNKKLTLALIWQLMRYHLISFLESLRTLSGSGTRISDTEIVRWANAQVASTGSSRTMKDFQDKSIANSLFLIDLLSAVEPRAINRDLVTPGNGEEERKMNAKYAISCARKVGCSIFLLWEDIVEVRPKMILSFIAALMAVALSRGKAGVGSVEVD